MVFWWMVMLLSSCLMATWVACTWSCAFFICAFSVVTSVESDFPCASSLSHRLVVGDFFLELVELALELRASIVGRGLREQACGMTAPAKSEKRKQPTMNTAPNRTENAYRASVYQT
jgi:hypothetical protein